MKAALLPDRGVLKVVGDDARNFLHGLVTADILGLAPGSARFCALLTPQGKIIADFIVTEAPAKDGGGFFLDVPRAVSGRLSASSIFTSCAPRSCRGSCPKSSACSLCGTAAEFPNRVWLMPTRACRARRARDAAPASCQAAAAELGAEFVDAGQYETHRIALGVPQGGIDFSYGDAFPHESDMDQLGGVDFKKGCYIGQEVVSRMEHRGTARTRAVPVRYDGAAPQAGAAVMAGDRQIGTMGSAAAGRAVALLRLDRVSEAMSRGEQLSASGVAIHVIKPDWARFAFPGEAEAA
jgi:folate-binding protein YgfZ